MSKPFHGKIRIDAPPGGAIDLYIDDILLCEDVQNLKVFARKGRYTIIRVEGNGKIQTHRLFGAGYMTTTEERSGGDEGETIDDR